MSAAAPVGPPPDRPSRITNGTNGAAARDPISGDLGGRAERIYPHLDDLVAWSNPEVDINATMRTLLQKAEASSKKADADVDFGRPDHGYVEYLVASNIIINMVPRHRDYPELCSRQGDLWRMNKAIQKKLNSQHQKFDSVRDIIKSDNARTGVRPLALNGLPVKPPPQDLLNKDIQGQVPYDNGATLRMPHMPDVPTLEPSASRIQSSPKRRPNVHPKPDHLHSRALHLNGAPTQPPPPPPGSDILAERFAKLRASESRSSTTGPIDIRSRVSSPTPRPTSSGSAYIPDSSTDTSSINGMTPTSSVGSLPPSSQYPSVPGGLPVQSRPSGPRNMPMALPYPPTTLPIDTSVASSLPRPPSPTYSPARSLPTPNNNNPQRTTSRSLAASTTQASFIAEESVVSQQQPQSYEISNSARNLPTSSGGGRMNPVPKRELNLPYDTSVSAQGLYDYLQRGSDNLRILLIDVRSREDFDAGHIFSQSIMCIEPLVLRKDMSADQIEETLVLSPENEQVLFSQRSHFDLIVYYDQSSSPSTVAHSPGGAASHPLASLHQAMYEFSYDKPLRRPPLHLIGGIDAWKDLVGEQALKVSESFVPNARLSSGLARTGRPVGRVPKATTTLRLEALRKQREQTQLNVEEEKAWLDRIRHDGDGDGRPQPHPPPSEDQYSTPNGRPGSEGEDSSFVRSYDDFLRRFPEQSSLESMTSPTSPNGRRNSVTDQHYQPAQTLQATLQHPSRPASAFERPLPSAPSRPPPAVPRTSYSGVSERHAYQPPQQARPPPIDSSRQIPIDTITSRSDIHIGRTGLTNFGATCYMNSVIQCLSATAPLTRFFLDGSYRNHVQRNKMGSHGVLPEVYYKLMWHLWHGGYSYISPKTFRDFISRLNGDFADPHVQHDANDFFVFLADCLHEDLNLNHNRTRLNELTVAEERRREAMPWRVASKVEWNRWSHRNTSFLSQIFSGQHLSRLQCTTCGFRSTSYETFNSLALEIPTKGRANIHDCLRNYTKEELLSADDCWTCPDCKAPRQALKKITITRCPQILVVQLKRFRSLRRGLTDKINTLIDFPLLRLDLTPYTARPLSPQEELDARRKFGPAIMEPERDTSPPFEYDAYAVVQHFGTLTGGHYKALVKGGAAAAAGKGRRAAEAGAWTEFNDRAATNFDSKRVQSPAAYLLFYARAGVPQAL